MFSNLSVAKKIGVLVFLTLISFVLIAVVNLVFLSSIKTNATSTQNNVLLLKEQTIKLLELSKSIQQAIFVAKGEGFSSIVAKKSIYANEQYKAHKKRVLDLCKELDEFIITYKKDDKELKELSDTINKKAVAYLATIEMFQSDLEDDYDYTISTLDTQVKPKEDTLIESTNQILDKVNKKFHTTFEQMADSSVKTTADVKNLNITVVIVIAIALLLVTLFTIYLINNIKFSLNMVQSGLTSFFAFLSGESSKADTIHLKGDDEFGQMATILNTNIIKTEKGIEEDRKLIDEAISVLGHFEQGDLSQRLNISVSNPSLMQLKNVLNKMAGNLESNITNILSILDQYTKYNYLDQVKTNGLKEHLLKLANGVNNLGLSITEMLKENKANGLTIDESSNVLLANVDRLNQSSNEAAASLEETAAAIEEMTGNIRSNTENIAKMANLANGVTKSARSGEQLANQTTIAMEEINAQVSLINEAIAVIDQIAFQTNILSLNAAVEAATAGEAGKGFAVVAGEVRNLASRSAEAAKEIKEIVERATSKANQGKAIANDMIQGYTELNQNIGQTITLIADIEHASKEQLAGIEQINDAVTRLDRQTQQNASVASQTQDVASLTDQIAKLIVDSADSKNFLGKNEVQVRKFR